MKYHSWRHLGVATLGFWVLGTNAQEPLPGLRELLEKHENLTSFSSFIKEYPEILLDLPSQQGVTILAPDNAAFAKIPVTALNKVFDQNDTAGITNALSYHILRGTKKTSDLVPGIAYNLPTLMTSSNYTNVTGGQRVTNIKQAGDVIVFVSGLGSRCEVNNADLEFDGGIVQVISNLLIPPANLTTTTLAYNLTSFQGALYTSDRVEALSSAKDLTIFAPTNEAFIALGPAIENMTVEQLSKVLDYHIIPDKLIYSADIKNGTKFKASNGQTISVQQIGNNIYLNSAQLLTKDILIANGVIHTLDNVLNPEDNGPAPDPKIATQPPVFRSASAVTNIPFTTAIPCTEECPVSRGGATNEGIGPTGTGASATSTSTGLRTSSSAALAAAMARETGFGGAGLLAVFGGAVMMI